MKSKYGEPCGSVILNNEVLRLYCQPIYKGEVFMEKLNYIEFNILNDKQELFVQFKLDASVTRGPQDLIKFLAECL